MLCDSLERWDGMGGAREGQEAGGMSMPMAIHVDVWQKATQCGHVC